MASRTPSQATEAHNLHRHCGPASVLSSQSNILRRLPTILNRTASWNASTAASRMPSAPERPEQTGTHTFLGCCEVSGQLGERIRISPLQRLFLVHSWFCQGSSFPLQSRRRRRSSGTSRAFWLAAPLFRQTTTLLQHPQPFRRICFCLVMCWSAMMPPSRRCRRCMMVRSWLLRGLYIFSKSRWVPGSKLFPHIASSLAMPHRMCRPPNRRAGVARRTPPQEQLHASLLAGQLRFCLHLQKVVVFPSPTH